MLEEARRKTWLHPSIPEQENDLRRMWSTEGSCHECESRDTVPLLKVMSFRLFSSVPGSQLVCECLDGQRRIPFGSVVDQHIGSTYFTPHSLSNDLHGISSHMR